MVIVDEFYHNFVFRYSSEKLIQVLQDIKSIKEKEIESIKDKIKKYEQTRRAQEVWYQSLSPLRKFFTGRPPSHHQAVEYIVNVKERFSHIESIKNRITELNSIIYLLNTEPEKEQVILANVIIDDIKAWKEQGGRIE